MSSLNTIIFDKKETGNFTQIPNYLIDYKDNSIENLPKLKPTARLLLMNLLNKPKGWLISLKDLAQRICVGLQALNTARKSLVLAGFIKVIRLKDKDSGLVLGTHYEASEKPIFYEENSKLDLKKGIYHVLYITYETFINRTFLPCDGNPTDGHPSDSYRGTINTNYINTDLSNTSEQKKESGFKKTFNKVKEKMSAVCFTKNKEEKKENRNYSSTPKIEKEPDQELTPDQKELINMIVNVKIENLSDNVIQEPVSYEKAKDLVLRFPERIHEQIKALPLRQIKSSVAGILIKSIENNIPVPKIEVSLEEKTKVLNQSTEKYLPVLKIWDSFNVYDKVHELEAKTVLSQKIISGLRKYKENQLYNPEFFIKLGKTVSLIDLKDCFETPSERLLNDLEEIIKENKWV